MHHDDVRRISTVLEAVGTPELGSALDDMTRPVAPFDMSCVFAYHPRHRPIVVHDGYSASVSREALATYVAGGYLLDPFYVAAVRCERPALWRMGELAPDEFWSSDFAGSVDVHPCVSDEAGALVEEVGFVCPLPGGWGAAYSLMRNRTESPFGADEFEALSVLAPLIGAAVAKHRETAPAEEVSEVDGAVARAFAGHLTPAQFRVVELVLRGHSSRSVAHALGITEGTAKVHRHDAYRRLGISSQSELFRLFLDHLERG